MPEKHRTGNVRLLRHERIKRRSVGEPTKVRADEVLPLRRGHLSGGRRILVFERGLLLQLLHGCHALTALQIAVQLPLARREPLTAAVAQRAGKGRIPIVPLGQTSVSLFTCSAIFLW
jgi:hypothetical protein